jgi:hypothetical protein
MERKRTIDITDLIEQAVENAIARRNNSLHSEAPLSLSDEEAANLVGGLVLPGLKPVYQPIKPSVTVGIIAPPPDQLLA